MYFDKSYKDLNVMAACPNLFFPILLHWRNCFQNLHQRVIQKKLGTLQFESKNLRLKQQEHWYLEWNLTQFLFTLVESTSVLNIFSLEWCTGSCIAVQICRFCTLVLKFSVRLYAIVELCIVSTILVRFVHEEVQFV